MKDRDEILREHKRVLKTKIREILGDYRANTGICISDIKVDWTITDGYHFMRIDVKGDTG